MRRLDAYTVYLLMEGCTALCMSIAFTVSAVYRVQTVGLDPFQLVLVGTVLEGAIFLFEVPTGVVADTFSRRLSIIIGVVLIGAGVMLEGLVPQFGAILLAQVVWGIGYTFTSGATEAWIADEVGEVRAGQAFLRGAQAGQAGTVAGIVISVALGSLQINLPIVLGGALMSLLGLGLIAVMPETGFRPTPIEERGSWAALGRTLEEGVRVVRGRRLLLVIMAIAWFAGMASEAFDRLAEAHFLENFTFPPLADFSPIVWFGIFSLGSLLLGLIAVEIVRRRIDTTDHRAVTLTLLGLTLALTVSMAVFGLAGGFGVALAAYWSARVSRRVIGPLSTAWLNQSIEPRVRATVISFHSQADAFGQVAGGPLIGLIGSLVSLRASLVTAAVVLTPALLLYALALRHGPAKATAAKGATVAGDG